MAWKLAIPVLLSTEEPDTLSLSRFPQTLRESADGKDLASFLPCERCAGSTQMRTGVWTRHIHGKFKFLCEWEKLLLAKRLIRWAWPLRLRRDLSVDLSIDRKIAAQSGGQIWGVYQLSGVALHEWWRMQTSLSGSELLFMEWWFLGWSSGKFRWCGRVEAGPDSGEVNVGTCPGASAVMSREPLG